MLILDLQMYVWFQNSFKFFVIIKWVLRLFFFFSTFPPPSLISDVAVVDMSDISKQPSLFYHLGVRESFDMANNVILYHGTDDDTAQSLKVRFSLQNLASFQKYL